MFWLFLTVFIVILGYNRWSFFKLYSNLYHYKLKFPLTSKQKFNSKFQGLETARILEKNDHIWAKKHYPNQTIIRKTNFFKVLNIFKQLRNLVVFMRIRAISSPWNFEVNFCQVLCMPYRFSYFNFLRVLFTLLDWKSHFLLRQKSNMLH